MHQKTSFESFETGETQNNTQQQSQGASIQKSWLPATTSTRYVTHITTAEKTDTHETCLS